MSSKRRQQMKKQRQAAEAAAAKKEKRDKAIKLLAAVGGVAVLAIVVVVVLIGLNAGGETPSKTVNTDKLLSGIPQNGTVLGNPNAPVTIVEYADLRCPFCAEFSQGGLKDLIEGPVRDGKVKIDFRHWAIIPGSSDVAYGMYAAAEQGRAWQFIKNFYNDQGSESGAVDFEKIKRIAEESGVSDMDKWEKDYNSAKWDEKMVKIDEEASGFGFSGTPAVAIIGSSGKLVETDIRFDSTLQDINQVIKENR